jgi:outer membrane protein TolC
MSRPLARALILLFATLAASAGAQTTPAIDPNTPLTLEGAVALAVQKNFDLQIQANSTESLRQSLIIAKAGFDPSISANLTRTFSESAASTTRLEGTSNDRTSFRAGITQPLIWTNGSLALSSNIGRAASNNTNDLFNPQFTNDISLSYTQPLLRNAGGKAARSNIARSQIGLSVGLINYKSQVLSLILSTESAYYSLVTARETLRIRQLSLDLAQKLFDENTARRNAGQMTDIDVLSAEVGVENSRRSVVQAEQSVRDAEDALLNLINASSFDSRPGPVKFDDYTEGSPNFARSYQLAREYYPATLSAEETLKQVQLDLDDARRNLRPNLNLTAGWGYTARPVSSSYSEVLGNLVDDHGHNWSLGLSYSMPWGRRVDKANYRRAQLSLNSQQLRLEQLQQQLLADVRQAVRTVETNLVAVAIASKATALAERQYDQQKARFDAGLTTSRNVLQFQDDLENARFNELSAKLTLRRAAATLHRLEGTSIDRYRIQLPQ